MIHVSIETLVNPLYYDTRFHTTTFSIDAPLIQDKSAFTLKSNPMGNLYQVKLQIGQIDY
jgi:hypothetical protein